MSWLRSEDVSVLTVGSLVFSSDTRLAVLPGQPVGSWRLRIQDVVARDQGEYQCQVNTEPKESAVVQLIVRGKNLAAPSKNETGKSLDIVLTGWG